MDVDLYLRNALVVSEIGEFAGGIAVKDGRVSLLVKGNPDLRASAIIDAQGAAVFPGMIDSHVHFNEPGRTQWEGMRTGSMAAAAGGVTSVVDMPINNRPAVVNQEIFEAKLAAVKDKGVVDFALFGGLVDNNLADLAGMDAAGAVAFKSFLSNSAIEDFPRIDDGVFVTGLMRISELDNVLVIHAENEYVTAYLSDQLQSQGRTDAAAWTESRPPSAELEAIHRALFWQRRVGGRLHVLHTSTFAGIEMVHQAQVDGQAVSVETCPHYLSLTGDDFGRIGPEAKCAPPLRPQKDVDALWEGVLAGMVDTIGSDHSPCSKVEKEAGDGNIWEAWGGISGIQTMLPVVLTEGVHRRRLPLKEICRMLSSEPARLMGLYPRKGSLLPGSDADFTLVDLEREWTLSREDLHYRNPHSPFIGRSFKGKVMKTIVRGRVVYDDGDFTVDPGYGQFMTRGYGQT